MNILNPTDDLLKYLACLILSHLFLLHNIVEKFSFLHIFHDQEQLLGSFNYLVELNNVGVSYQLQDVYFSAHSLHVSHINYLIFLQYFNCHFLSGQSVDA